MIPYYGDYPEDHAEIRIPFNTFDSNDPSASVTITDLVDGDIEVHADGDTTQIATDGASVIINFAGETGSHMILIDSSVDAAYTTATEYAVKIVGTTIDGATVNAWIGTFSIERSGGALATALLTNTVVDGIAAQLAGITLLNEWLGAIAGDQNADATALTEIRASGAGSGSYDPNTDSIEAIRNTAPLGTAMRGTESAALASVLGALDDTAAAGDPTTSDTIMDYIKQLVNVLVGSTGVVTYPVEQAPANNINLAEVIRAIHADVTGLAGSAMIGTNSAALASVVGAIDDAAAGGDPTSSDTLVQYIKQLINILVGTDGVVTFPAEQAPANAVSLAEVIRAIHVDTNKLAFTVANQVDANMLAISGDTAAADLLEALMDGGVLAQVNDASATTTAFAADQFTEATDDHFNGRLITFSSGALKGQQTDVTDYDAAGGAQGSQEFTVTALTEAPADGDFFVIH